MKILKPFEHYPPFIENDYQYNSGAWNIGGLNIPKSRFFMNPVTESDDEIGNWTVERDENGIWSGIV